MTAFETTHSAVPIAILMKVTGCASGPKSHLLKKFTMGLTTPDALFCCSVKNIVITGTGIDLIEIARIQHAMDRYGQRFLNRVYLAGEQAYCLRKRNSAESFAARFAAKEAAAKALGTGISYGVSWLEFEVVREPSGRPTLRFHGRAAEIAARQGVAQAHLSLTHTVNLAVASVVLEDGR